MTYRIRLNVPLSDEHYEAIGRVAANWSMIESAVERYIWFMLSFGENVGRCVTTNMHFIERVKCMLTLAHDTFSLNGKSWREAELEELTNFVRKELNELREDRNDVVHGVWSEESEEIGIVKTSARRELSISIRPFSVASINELAEKIESAFVRLNELLLALNPKDEIGLERFPGWLDERCWAHE